MLEWPHGSCCQRATHLGTCAAWLRTAARHAQPHRPTSLSAWAQLSDGVRQVLWQGFLPASGSSCLLILHIPALRVSWQQVLEGLAQWAGALAQPRARTAVLGLFAAVGTVLHAEGRRRLVRAQGRLVSGMPATPVGTGLLAATPICPRRPARAGADAPVRARACRGVRRGRAESGPALTALSGRSPHRCLEALLDAPPQARRAAKAPAVAPAPLAEAPPATLLTALLRQSGRSWWRSSRPRPARRPGRTCTRSAPPTWMRCCRTSTSSRSTRALAARAPAAPPRVLPRGSGRARSGTMGGREGATWSGAQQRRDHAVVVLYFNGVLHMGSA